jgi:hypothetical protein
MSEKLVRWINWKDDEEWVEPQHQVCARCGHTTPHCERCGVDEPFLGGSSGQDKYCHYADESCLLDFIDEEKRATERRE